MAQTRFNLIETEFIKQCDIWGIPIPIIIKPISTSTSQEFVSSPHEIHINDSEENPLPILYQAHHLFGHYLCDLYNNTEANAALVVNAITKMLNTIENKVTFTSPNGKFKNGDK